MSRHLAEHPMTELERKVSEGMPAAVHAAEPTWGYAVMAEGVIQKLEGETAMVPLDWRFIVMKAKALPGWGGHAAWVVVCGTKGRMEVFAEGCTPRKAWRDAIKNLHKAAPAQPAIAAFRQDVRPK